MPSARGAGNPIFQVVTANLNPFSETKVDTKNPDRGPLLIIGGELLRKVRARTSTHATVGVIAKGESSRNAADARGDERDAGREEADRQDDAASIDEVSQTIRLFRVAADDAQEEAGGHEDSSPQHTTR